MRMMLAYYCDKRVGYTPSFAGKGSNHTTSEDKVTEMRHDEMGKRVSTAKSRQLNNQMLHYILKKGLDNFIEGIRQCLNV